MAAYTRPRPQAPNPSRYPDALKERIEKDGNVPSLQHRLREMRSHIAHRRINPVTLTDAEIKAVRAEGYEVEDGRLVMGDSVLCAEPQEQREEWIAYENAQAGIDDMGEQVEEKVEEINAEWRRQNPRKSGNRGPLTAMDEAAVERAKGEPGADVKTLKELKD